MTAAPDFSLPRDSHHTGPWARAVFTSAETLQLCRQVPSKGLAVILSA